MTGTKRGSFFGSGTIPEPSIFFRICWRLPGVSCCRSRLVLLFLSKVHSDMLNQVTGADTSPVFGYWYPPDPHFSDNRHEKHETESTKPDRSGTMDVDIRPETDMWVLTQPRTRCVYVRVLPLRIRTWKHLDQNIIGNLFWSTIWGRHGSRWLHPRTMFARKTADIWPVYLYPVTDPDGYIRTRSRVRVQQGVTIFCRAVHM